MCVCVYIIFIYTPGFRNRESKLRNYEFVEVKRMIITTFYIDRAIQVCFFTSFNVPILFYE